LETFDDGSVKSSLIGRNKKANTFKSWVVWIKYQNEIAYEDCSVIEKKWICFERNWEHNQFNFQL
jgi:hypothetical protein